MIIMIYDSYSDDDNKWRFSADEYAWILKSYFVSLPYLHNNHNVIAILKIIVMTIIVVMEVMMILTAVLGR